MKLTIETPITAVELNTITEALGQHWPTCVTATDGQITIETVTSEPSSGGVGVASALVEQAVRDAGSRRG